MKRLLKSYRCLMGCLTACLLAGCVSQPQLTDFYRSEFARLVSDVVGQMFLIFIQSISPLSAA